MLPNCLGRRDSENDASWALFLTKLQEFVPNIDDLVFISDRHQSIEKEVCNVYKNAHHSYCMWHVEQNLKSLYICQDAIDLFKKAAQAYHIS